MNKPYAESCDQNREPIFAVLEPRLKDSQTLLEIGSGTGQHAVYFAADLPHLTWQTSDRTENHPGIRMWLEEAALANVEQPLALDVLTDAWPDQTYDAIYSANTLHIMNHSMVEATFAGIGRVLAPGGQFLVYGPFNYNGEYTSDSNARFDVWLKDRNPESGIKDVDWLKALADAAGMELAEDVAMPANNRILVWRKQASV